MAGTDSRLAVGANVDLAVGGFGNARAFIGQQQQIGRRAGDDRCGASGAGFCWQQPERATARATDEAGFTVRNAQHHQPGGTSRLMPQESARNRAGTVITQSIRSRIVRSQSASRALLPVN
jgi:hypothetical protein